MVGRWLERMGTGERAALLLGLGLGVAGEAP